MGKRHTSKKLKKAGRDLASKCTTKKQKTKASKVLNKHKKSAH